MGFFRIFKRKTSRRRAMDTVNFGSFISSFEPRALLSSVAIYPQPASALSVDSVDAETVDARNAENTIRPSKIGRKDDFDFKQKVKFTVSNSGSSPLEITLTALFDKDADGFAKEYGGKVPAQKSKHFTAKIPMYKFDEFESEGRFAVTVLRGPQAVMNDVKFDVIDWSANSRNGTKWGTLVHEDQQLDIAYLNGQLIWSVNPLQ